MRRASRVGFVALMMVVGVALAPPAQAQDFAFEFGDPAKPEPERLEAAASSIAVDADGNPWVADTGKDRIVKYGYDGAFVAEFRTMGDVALTSPTGIAADDQGFLYVALSSDARIVKLDTGGRPRGTIGLAEPDGTPVRPVKLAVDGAGRLYVADGESTVYVFEQDGTSRGRITLPSGWPVRDVTLNNGRIVVTHGTAVPDNDGVRIYGADLRFVTQLGPFVDVSYRELIVDQAGRANIADFRNGFVRRINLATGAQDTLGGMGVGVGQLNGPTGMAIDCRGNVYALESAARYDGEGGPRPGSKVLKFTVAAEPPPCAPRPLPEGAIETQINDIEVTQAVQPPLSYTAGPLLPAGQLAFTVPETRIRTRAFGQSTGGSPSGELPLKARLRAVVRVFANLNAGPAGGLANIPATLDVTTQAGARLGELQPVGRPALLRVGSRTVDAARRTDPNAAYSFELPDDWTDKGPLTFAARINPAGTGCNEDCVNRSTFRLSGVPFSLARVAPVAPIALTVGGRRPVKDPTRVFQLAQRVTPLLLEVSGWQADVEVADLLSTDSVTVESCFIGIFPCDDDTFTRGSPEFRQYLQGQLMDRLERAADDRNIRECDRIPIGVAQQNLNLPGAMSGELLAAGFLPCALGYVTVDRPLTSVAHELQHAFGRPHAGQSCPGTRDGDDQEGELWPPDDRGLLGGVGLNTGRRGLGARGPYDVIAPGVAPNPSEIFDLMSYCAGGEASAWISPRGWSTLFNWRVNVARKAQVAAPSQAPGGGRRLRVTATQTSGGKLGITGVSPARDPGEPVDPASPYVLEAMDEVGKVLSAAPAAARRIPDGGGTIITGTVAAPTGTRQVFLRRGTETGTRRVATPNAPTVRLVSPRAGQRVATGNVSVRWQAADRDGGKLIATVEYSANGGRSWLAIQVGPSNGRVALPRTMLAGSTRGRVRVRIDDGFNEAVATSRPFTVVGAPPTVSITAPESNLTIRADSPLTLRGGATGAFGRPLAGARLRWSDGRRRLGRGDSITVGGLRAGRHRITLSAAQAGATGRASRTVTVRAVKPAFLRRDAPVRIGRRARTVSLRVASTVQATLTAGGKRFDVSPRSRRITVRIKPGTAALKLPLTLRSSGLRTRETITISRS